MPLTPVEHNLYIVNDVGQAENSQEKHISGVKLDFSFGKITNGHNFLLYICEDVRNNI